MAKPRVTGTIGAVVIGAAVGKAINLPWSVLSPFLVVSLFLLIRSVRPTATDKRIAALPCGAWLNQKLSDLDGLLAGDTSAEKALETLSDNVLEGHKILRRPVNSEEEFEEWKADQTAWGTETSSEIEIHFGKPQAVACMVIGSVPAADMPPSFSEEHNTLKLHLNKRLDNLKAFLATKSGNLESGGQ